MPIDTLSYQGINRAFSDFAAQRACEELINLRPTSVGLVPVKDFTTKITQLEIPTGGLPVKKVYTHKAGNRTNRIAITINDGYIYIYWISDAGQVLNSGNPIGTITISPYTYLSPDDIHFATAGNIILFSVAYKGSTPYVGTQFKNLSLLWTGTGYTAMEANIGTGANEVDSSIPNITASIVLPSGASSADLISFTTNPDKGADNAESFQSALNEAQEKNPNLCFGTVIIAIAFKTKDGNTFWTGQWLVYDPVKYINTYASNVIRSTDDPTGYPRVMFDDYFNAGNSVGYAFSIYSSTYQKLWGTALSVQLSQISGTWNSSTSMIESVEIYSSRPQLYIDPGQLRKGNIYYGVEPASPALDPVYAIILSQKPYSEMSLDGQLLYHQKSVNISELANGAKTYELEFGGSLQTTNRTLEVDAGMVTRYGEILSYNARFHYFDSVSKTGIPMPDFSFASSYTTYLTYVFVVFNDGQKDHTLYVGTKYLPLASADIVIAHPMKVKEVITYYQGSSYQTANSYIYKYSMEESATYNYSICVRGSYLPLPLFPRNYTYDTLIYNGITNFKLTDEPNAINVTEQYNPFVFKVDHSYLAPGKVLDVQPQMVAVQDVSYGDYPLNVFTNRGVYALLQGNGMILYAAFRPISNLIITTNSIPTESGTFFLAAGGLWLISGAKAILISDALSMGPHKYIRTCKGFDQLCQGDSMNSPTPSPQTGTYDIKVLQSQVVFKDYIEGLSTTNPANAKAMLSYNRYRDELFISNPAYPYTYVLSLKYRQWFKINKIISQDVPGSDIANTPVTVSGVIKLNILDLEKEVDGHKLVHLQSRPFSFSYQYAHIHRIVSMIRANLSKSTLSNYADSLIVGLYGSDDLQEWNLLCFSDRQGTLIDNDGDPLKISQIRTPSSGRSWRYYTVCIGGTTPTDTDFGPVMVDYEPVIRRLG